MKKRQWLIPIFSFFIFHFLLLGSAHSKPITQTFSLDTGWNAVFLEVQPTSTVPADVFAGISANLQSVWMWNPNSGTVEFIQNPSELVPNQPQYLTYLPADPILTNLHAILGNRAYLIQMNGPATLNISGEPLPPAIDWEPNSFNFVGFHLDPANLPSFTNFFISSPAHIDQEIYVLDNATASWVKVTDSSVAMEAGEGFWIYCKGSSEFVGPVAVQLQQGKELQYGKTLEQQEITVKNDSNSLKTVSLNLADKTPGPDYPLFYWEFDPENDIARWSPLPAEPATLAVSLAPGEKQVLRLGVKRAGLNAGTGYTANLQLKDTESSLFKVPVSVTGISYAGLWVGDVTINKVNQLSHEVDPSTPRPTGSLFTFRLILHHSDTDVTNLMSQVLQMWHSAATPEESGYVLFSDDSLIPFYSGASLRDGQPVGRRISSPVLGNLYDAGKVPVGNHIAMTGGGFAQDGGTLAVTLTLPKDDPSNPFVHKFHPDHLPPDAETPAENYFELTRSINLTFSDTDSDGNPIFGNSGLGWGSSALGGRYHETISGLLKPGDDIALEGVFTLHRVSDVGILTTAVP